MKEQTEVLTATARLLNAVAATLENANNPDVKAEFEEKIPDVVTQKPRKEKKTAAPAAPPSAPAFDPMMDVGDAPKSAAPAAPAAMTEAESTLKAQEANKALVKAFPTIGADKMPEGFHKAKALLSEFGVARTTDLVHAQRVSYIAKIDALIAAKPA